MKRTNEERNHIDPEQFEAEVENLLRRVGTDLPEFEVQRLEKIQASDGVYEIDVTARFEVLGASFLVLIECKHHKNPIKREVVQVLYDRLRAVGAHKGMMFSTAKFQRGAIEFARAHRIALIQLEDLRPFHAMSFSCVSNRTVLDCNLRRMNANVFDVMPDAAGAVLKKGKRETKTARPRREIVDRETALARMKSLPKRKQKLIDAIRGRGRRGVVK